MQKIIKFSEEESLIYELFKKIDGTCEENEYEHWLFKQGFIAHKELVKAYSRDDVHSLMCKAFEAGYKKADVVEAGLEALVPDIESAWILTKFDSTPKN